LYKDIKNMSGCKNFLFIKIKNKKGSQNSIVNLLHEIIQRNQLLYWNFHHKQFTQTVCSYFY